VKGYRKILKDAPVPEIEVMPIRPKKDLRMSGWLWARKKNIAKKTGYGKSELWQSAVVLFAFRPQFRAQPSWHV